MTIAHGQACIFGATGGIGKALTLELARRKPDWTIYAGGRRTIGPVPGNVRSFRFELEDEQNIATAAHVIGQSGTLDLVIVATGILHGEGFGPEKTWRTIDDDVMARIFSINAIAPAVIAKHFLPLLDPRKRAVFAAISARVGSISDNRLGGWYSYRASKAALNMLICTFAIELRRKNPKGIVAALHPGTVDTALSEPFQANVPDGKLFPPQYSAERMLDVVENLTESDSGGHFAWDGRPIPA